MVKCLDCGNFNVETRFCSYYHTCIKAKSAEKSVPCNGFVKADKRVRAMQKRMGNRRVCISCPEFKQIGNVGECGRYGWLISVHHAERDRVCDFVDKR